MIEITELLIYFIMDVIEHNKIKVVSDYLYKTNTNPKTIVKKEMIIGKNI